MRLIEGEMQMQRQNLDGQETTKGHVQAIGRTLLVDVIIMILGCALGLTGLLLASSPMYARIFFPGEALLDQWFRGPATLTFLLALVHYPVIAVIGVLLRTAKTRVRYLGILALIHVVLLVLAMLI